MKKKVLFLCASFLAFGVSSCNDDDSNLQSKVIEKGEKAKSANKIGILDNNKIQSAAEVIYKENDLSEDADTEKEKTFPCKGWDCVQIAD